MSDNESIAPHVDEIIRALGDKVEKSEIEEEFSRYLDEFGLTPAEAKRSILRRYGASVASAPSASVEKSIEELDENDRSVSMLCRIVYVNNREITQNGEKKTIVSGIAGDNTGTRPFTIWNINDDLLALSKGDVIKMENAYVTKWQNEVQINLGDRGTVKVMPRDAMDDYEAPRTVTEKKIGDLQMGFGRVAIEGRILNVENREVNTKDGPKTIFSGLIADETGKVSFTSWHDFGLKNDQVVTISGGYLKQWRGVLQLNFDDSAIVETLEKDFAPAIELDIATSSTIEEILQKGGGDDLSVNGVIMEVKDWSGLISRCPECNRVLKRGACRNHGDVEGVQDLRTKAILDDGTGAMNVIIGKEQTEELLGKTMDECVEEAKEAMDTEIIQDQLHKKIFATHVSARGNVLVDEFGPMMIVRDISMDQTDVRAEAEKMLGGIQ